MTRSHSLLGALLKALIPVVYLLLVGGLHGGRRGRGPAVADWLDIDHFEEFCRRLKLDTGAPFILQPFQRQLLADYFNGTTETLVLIPKKNGKTTLMAALVLYHLCFVDEARCYVAAASKDQASILYDHAVGFVKRSASLQKRVLVRGGTRTLRSRRDEGFVRVLAADSDTADGVGPTLAIVDELHRHKSTALYDVFRDGLDARQGAMLTISTAGDDEDGPLGQMRAKALAMRGIKRKGRYTYARSRDGSFVMHEWALRPTDDLEDLDLVKQVNPLKAQTKAALRRRRDSPSMTSHTWARFACNVWTQDETAAISALDWAKIALTGCRIPDDAIEVVIGIDLGWTQDTSAFVPVGFAPDNRDVAIIDDRLKIVHPPGDGTAIDEEVLKDALRELHAIWPHCRFAIDPNAGGQGFAQWIERELSGGEPVILMSQQPAPMQEVSMHFSAGIRAKQVEEERDPETEELVTRIVPIRHPDNPGLNRHCRAAQARYNGERWRFDKRRVASSASSRVRPRPIDGLISSSLGYRALTAPAEETLEPFVFAG